MPVLLSQSFSTGDTAYSAGTTYPRAKITQLRWFSQGTIRLLVEVGDVSGSDWQRGSDVSNFEFSITGSDYATVVTLTGSAGLSTYENVKQSAYEWLTEHTRFSGTIE
jgi:hypothetical protein